MPKPTPGSIYVLEATETFYGVVAVADDKITCNELSLGAVLELRPEEFSIRMRPTKKPEREEVQAVLKRLRALRSKATKANVRTCAGIQGDEIEVLSDCAGGVAESVSLYAPSERDAFNRLVLWPECVQTICATVQSVMNRKAMDERWGLSALQPMENRCLINLYGPPGTGKSRIARAVAFALSKQVCQVDYAQLTSKFVGETGKHIAAAFASAKELNAVLFFDEADALFSRRSEGADGNSVSNNLSRIVLMQELDAFDGVVIATTNLFGNYDPAILRRIARHVEVALPDEEMRKRLFDLHLPKKDYVRPINWDSIALLTEGFSGGDICTTVLNALEYASLPEEVEDWWLEEHHIATAAAECARSKKAHVNGAG